MALFRAYDADLARWISRDPIGETGGLNLYGYVINNPVNFVDPAGLFGIFGFGGGNIEAGAGSGGGAQAGSGAGVFGGGTGGINVGGFTQTGSFASEEFGGKGNEFAAGASLGLGAGLGITNADCAEQLKGPFDTWTLSTPFGSLQFAKSGSIWTASYTYGRGEGLSFSRYSVTTNEAGTWW